jgi:hypothetical protein
VKFESRPRREPVPARQRLLRVSETLLWPPRLRDSQDVFCLLLQVIEIGDGRQSPRHRSPFYPRPLTGMKRG